MSDRTKSVPRSAGDILREMAERAKSGRAPNHPETGRGRTLPTPPADAPTPPSPHQDQERDP